MSDNAGLRRAVTSCVWIILSVAIGLALAVLCPALAHADTLEVCKDGCAYLTIWGALEDVKPGDDVWVRAGEYREDQPVRLRPGVRVHGEDPLHPEWTIIRAEGGNAVVGTGDILTTTCVLEGFTIINVNGRGMYIQNGAAEIIRNNVFSGCVTSYQGAAIRIDDGGTMPTIVNNVFINNHCTTEGGAIYVENASPVISNNQFISNFSDKDGGALAIRSIEAPGQRPVITNNEFLDNSAHAKGGAIYLEQSRAHIQGNHVLSNTATAGAGIFVNSRSSAGPGLIQGNWLAYNRTIGSSAQTVGGALAVANGADCLIDANTIRYNSASSGDGIYIANSTPKVTNNVLATNGEAEITIVAAGPDIVNNTILSAGSPDTLGIDLLGASHARIINNVIAFAGIGIRGDGVAQAELQYNDLWQNLIADYSGVNGSATNLALDPRLRDPANGDCHLQPDSPLIDAGMTSEAPAADIDGDPRPLDGNGDGAAGADIGADEYLPGAETPTPTATMTSTCTPTATVTPMPTDTSTPTCTPTATAPPGPTITPTSLPLRLLLPIIRKG